MGVARVQAVKLAEECELLPYRRKGPPAQALSSWPEFFEERRWKEISVFAKMVLNTVKLCVSTHSGASHTHSLFQSDREQDIYGVCGGP